MQGLCYVMTMEAAIALLTEERSLSNCSMMATNSSLGIHDSPSSLRRQPGRFPSPHLEDMNYTSAEGPTSVLASLPGWSLPTCEAASRASNCKQRRPSGAAVTVTSSSKTLLLAASTRSYVN